MTLTLEAANRKQPIAIALRKKPEALPAFTPPSTIKPLTTGVKHMIVKSTATAQAASELAELVLIKPKMAQQHVKLGNDTLSVEVFATADESVYDEMMKGNDWLTNTKEGKLFATDSLLSFVVVVEVDKV